MSNVKMSLEAREYINFKRMYRNNEYPNQRFGQAFYNHFKLHKSSHPTDFNGLFELNGEKAIEVIHTIFEFE